MKSQLTISKPLPKAIVSRELNSQNGNDSEMLSASSIINAFGAEIRWGSRNEDNSKIDLFISYNHPWYTNERIILLVQVKSGDSYGKVSGGKATLYKRAFKEVRRSLSNICLVWLNNDSGLNYWTYIQPHTKIKLAELGRNHLLSPAVRFEIARYVSRNYRFTNFGGKGLILNLNISHSPLKDRRKLVRAKYRNMKNVLNPSFGLIEFTKTGWDHMFRSSRQKLFKSHSLFIIPYLKTILEQRPKRHWTKNFETYKRKNFTFCQYEHILAYEDITTTTGEKGKVIVKLLEEVGYPDDWKQQTLLSQKVVRRVVLKSCSWKKI